MQQIAYFLGICFLRHKYSHFSTYQTGVFSWQPHTFLQETVKQTKAWASQQPFWSIQPSSFLLYKMWWLFVVNHVVTNTARTWGLFNLKWHFRVTLQSSLKTGDRSQLTNLFFSLLHTSLSEQLKVNIDCYLRNNSMTTAAMNTLLLFLLIIFF